MLFLDRVNDGAQIEVVVAHFELGEAQVKTPAVAAVVETCCSSYFGVHVQLIANQINKKRKLGYRTYKVSGLP